MIELWQLPLLFGTGLVAGFVDSIAGGGGLITLPVLLRLGAGPNRTDGLHTRFGGLLKEVHEAAINPRKITRALECFSGCEPISQVELFQASPRRNKSLRSRNRSPVFIANNHAVVRPAYYLALPIFSRCFTGCRSVRTCAAVKRPVPAAET